MAVKVKFLGKKKYHVDRIFGTRIIWHGRNDIQLVERKIARAMVKHFPSVYKIVRGTEHEQKQVLLEQVHRNEGPLDNIRIKVATTGRNLKIADAPYNDVRQYLIDEYGLNVPDGATKEQLLNEVEQMLKHRENYVSVPAAEERKDIRKKKRDNHAWVKVTPIERTTSKAIRKIKKQPIEDIKPVVEVPQSVAAEPRGLIDAAEAAPF